MTRNVKEFRDLVNPILRFVVTKNQRCDPVLLAFNWSSESRLNNLPVRETFHHRTELCDALDISGNENIFQPMSRLRKRTS